VWSERGTCLSGTQQCTVIEGSSGYDTIVIPSHRKNMPVESISPN
jgi:hypothetical protein